MDVRHYISVYHDTFSKQECEALIAKFEHHKELQESKTNVGSDGWSMRFTQIQLGQHQEFEKECEALRRLFLKLITEYKREHGIQDGQWPKNFKLEPFRMKRYLPNTRDSFDAHVDVSDHASSKRFLVAFIYLNDEFEGGETDFTQFKLKVKPQSGSMILFPPMWNWLHKANPVYGSEPKYIVGTYMHYV